MKESPWPRCQLQLLEAFSSTRCLYYCCYREIMLSSRASTSSSLFALHELRCSIQISIQRNWQSNQSSSNTNYYIYYISVLCLMSQRTRSRRSSRSPEHKLDMGNNGCGTSLLWLLWLEMSLRQWKNLLDLDANFNCSKPSRVSPTVVTGKSGYHLEHRLHLLCALIIALRKLRCSIQIYIQRNWQSNLSSSNTNYYKYLCTVFDVAKN